MDFTRLYNQLSIDFDLNNLSDKDKEQALLEICKTIQKQFLLDIYDILGKEKFSTLETSAKMGDDYYTTTLRHLVPNYEEIFLNSRMKIVSSYNKETVNN